MVFRILIDEHYISVCFIGLCVKNEPFLKKRLSFNNVNNIIHTVLLIIIEQDLGQKIDNTLAYQ